MGGNRKRILTFSFVLLFSCLLTPSASAMHIMEGYLPAGYSIAWGVACVPFLAAGVYSIRGIVRQKRKTLLVFAMAGANSFVLSALKLPSITGSSSHPTGAGLGAILFGPAPMSVIGAIVLLFQALLLAHGGITTLGANIFSMAVAGPFLSWGIYRLCKALKVKNTVAVFLSAGLGDLFTYIVTSFQLAAAYPGESGGIGDSMLKFTGVFAVTQIPIAIIEGLLTVVVIMGLEAWARPELELLGYMEGEVNAN